MTITVTSVLEYVAVALPFAIFMKFFWFLYNKLKSTECCKTILSKKTLDRIFGCLTYTVAFNFWIYGVVKSKIKK